MTRVCLYSESSSPVVYGFFTWSKQLLLSLARVVSQFSKNRRELSQESTAILPLYVTGQKLFFTTKEVPNFRSANGLAWVQILQTSCYLTVWGRYNKCRSLTPNPQCPLVFTAGHSLTCVLYVSPFFKPGKFSSEISSKFTW